MKELERQSEGGEGGEQEPDDEGRRGGGGYAVDGGRGQGRGVGGEVKRGGGGGLPGDAGKGKGGGGKTPIAKVFPSKPRPACIDTETIPSKRGRELGEPPDPISTEEPTEAATPRMDQGDGKAEGGEGTGGATKGWVDSSVSTSMEEFLRTTEIPQPQQLTPAPVSQRARADVITSGGKDVGSPAKLRRVGGGEEAVREEVEIEDFMMEETVRQEGGRGEDGEISPTQVFTGGLEAGKEGKHHQGIGCGGDDDEDGQGGNGTPHTPTEPWSDHDAPMEDEDGGERDGGGGGIDIPQRLLPPGEGQGGGGGGIDIPPRPLPPGEGQGGEGGIDIPQRPLPPGEGQGGGTGAGGRRSTTTEKDSTMNGQNVHYRTSPTSSRTTAKHPRSCRARTASRSRRKTTTTR